MTKKEAIWRRALRTDDVNRIVDGSLVSHVGIRCTEIGPDFVMATMPVDHRTRQPYGLLHGGASMVLAESLASIAGTLAVTDQEMVVGIEINGNHVRQARGGHVTGRAKAVSVGRRIHVWQVDITDSEGHLVCTSRVTLAVLPAASDVTREDSNGGA